MVETRAPDDSSATTADDVLGFWFSEAVRPKWFKPDADFDTHVAHRFGALFDRASRGELNDWLATPESALALVIVLDQFPRNMFRGAPRAFASDPRALSAAERAIARGSDRALSDERRVFLYLPYMHSERLTAQDRGVVLFQGLGREENLDFMKRHRAIIARFGRFPHRNDILGRASTPEEIEFLKDESAWF